MMASRSTALIRGLARSALRGYSVVAPQSAPSSSSSTSSSSSWKPPIAPGIEPAYDEALNYISTQQARLRQQIPSLESEVQKHPSGTIERQIAQARLKSFVIASQINDPEIRWRFENDPNVPLSNDVFAHLREKAWRTTRLPRLMERIRVMSVLPDAISHITPVVDMQVAFGEGEGIHDHGGSTGDVVPGCFVGAEKTVEPPTITATPSHAEERLYTLAMVDTDAPYEAEERFGTFAHWLVHNIPISLTKTKVDPSLGDVALPYIPPYPARGTKYHRYTLVLFQQPEARITNTSPLERDYFSLHTLADELSLAPAGIHFWRSEWTKTSKPTISSIYKDVLQRSEPTY